jgi:predicted transcriptional regulator
MSKESGQKSRKYTPEYKLELVMETYMRIICKLREMYNMTKNQLVNYLGTSQTMYARYENGLSKIPIHHIIMLIEL